MRTAKLAVFVGLVVFLAICCFLRQAAGAEKERFHNWNLKKVAEVTKETTTKTVIKVVPRVLEKSLETLSEGLKTAGKVVKPGQGEKREVRVEKSRPGESQSRKSPENQKKKEGIRTEKSQPGESQSRKNPERRLEKSEVSRLRLPTIYIPRELLGAPGAVKPLRQAGYGITMNPNSAFLILRIDIDREERGGSFGGYYGGYGSPGRGLRRFFSNHRGGSWGGDFFDYGYFSDLGARGTLYKCRAMFQNRQGRVVAYGESSSLGGFEIRIPSRYVGRIGIPNLGGAERAVRSAVEKMIADHQLSFRAATSKGADD